MCDNPNCSNHTSPAKLAAKIMNIFNKHGIFPDSPSTAIALYTLYKTSMMVSKITDEEIQAAMYSMVEELSTFTDTSDPDKQDAKEALLSVIKKPN